MPSVRKFIGERFMNREWFSEHFGASADLVLSHIGERVIQKQKKLVAYLTHIGEGHTPLQRGLVLGPEQLDQLCNQFGSDDSDTWRGQPVRVFVDDTIMFGDKQVGGVRMEKRT